MLIKGMEGRRFKIFSASSRRRRAPIGIFPDAKQRPPSDADSPLNLIAYRGNGMQIRRSRLPDLPGDKSGQIGILGRQSVVADGKQSVASLTPSIVCPTSQPRSRRTPRSCCPTQRCRSLCPADRLPVARGHVGLMPKNHLRFYRRGEMGMGG